jgi:hypothetical protein
MTFLLKWGAGFATVWVTDAPGRLKLINGVWDASYDADALSSINDH